MPIASMCVIGRYGRRSHASPETMWTKRCGEMYLPRVRVRVRLRLRVRARLWLRLRLRVVCGFGLG